MPPHAVLRHTGGRGRLWEHRGSSSALLTVATWAGQRSTRAVDSPLADCGQWAAVQYTLQQQPVAATPHGVCLAS